MRLLLVDNSKSECAFYTPRLEMLFQQMNVIVVKCRTKQDIIDGTTNNEHIDAIVMSGSSLNVTEEHSIDTISKHIMPLLLLPNVPVLGICYGMQLMALLYGGVVRRMGAHRDEMAKVDAAHLELLRHVPLSAEFKFAHQDVVVSPPPMFRAARNAFGGIDVIENVVMQKFGVQFHPEASRAAGESVISNFLSIVASSSR